MTNGQSTSKLWLQLKFTRGWHNKWDQRNNKIFTSKQVQLAPSIHPSICPFIHPLYHALWNVCFCTSGMQNLTSTCYVVKCTIQYNKEIRRLKINHYWSTKEKLLHIRHIYTYTVYIYIYCIYLYIISAIVYS